MSDFLQLRKILIFASGYPPNVKGGGEFSTMLLAEGLASLGHEVNVIACGPKDTRQTTSESKVNVQRIESPNIFWNFQSPKSTLLKLTWHILENFNPKAISLVSNLLKKMDPDIVLTSTIENFGSSIWIACDRLRVPVIHVLRSYYCLCIKGTMYKNESICRRACGSCLALTVGRRRYSHRVDSVVGISSFILNSHKRLFSNSIRRVISNPVDVADTNTSRSLPAGIVFGYLGRIEKEKGIEELLEAFSRLPENPFLVIAGTGAEPYVGELIKRYASHRISFVGWANASTILDSITYLIVPSEWNEPFGRVVIESYSHGIPVIASMRGGLPELVSDGQTGYLFDPTYPNDLFNALVRAVEGHSEFARLRANVLERAKDFSSEKIALEYTQLIEDVLCAQVKEST